MHINKRYQITAGLMLAMLHGVQAANYVLENSMNSFWDTPQSWHEPAVWKDGVVVPSPSTHDVSVSSKPVDHIVNLSEAPVSIKSLIVGRYATDADLVTLNVTTNLDLSYRLQIGYDGGNAAVAVSNTTVTVANKLYLGSAVTNSYSGDLTINNGGIVEVSDFVNMYTNGTLTVNDGGTVKMLAPSGSRMTMTDTSEIYLNGTAELWLAGDQTAAGSVFNGYVNNGWVYGDGAIGNIEEVFDGTNTVVTVAPVKTGTATIQNNDSSFWSVSRSWHDARVWKDGLPDISAGVVMTAKPIDYTVNLSDAAVTINNLKTKFGPTGGGGTVTPTLNVQTSLTIDNFLQLGVEENGAMVVDGVNFVLVKGDTTLGSTSFAGSLTLTNSGIMRCNNPLVMNTNSMVTVNGGILKLLEDSAAPLAMSDGAVIDIVGTNSVMQVYGDQTGAGTDLATYISNGWIIGDGGASDVGSVYDSTNNLTRVLVSTAKTYDDFAQEHGISGQPNGGEYEDYDGDGQLNIYEFGLGGNPTNSLDIGTEPVYDVLEQGGTNVIEYVHVRLVNADLDYYLETDDDLVADPGWTNTGWSVVGVGPEIDGFETVTNEVDASGGVGFVRLVIE